MQLPRQLIYSLFGFECELDRQKADADFALSIELNSPAHKVLADMDQRCGLLAGTHQGAAWRRIQDFCSLWLGEDPSFQSHIPHIYLEFDLKSPESTAAVPSVFLGLRSGMRRERNVALQQFVPFVSYKVHPVATISQIDELIEELLK